MKLFKIYTPEKSPSVSAAILNSIRKSLGFVPNVFAVMGGTPPVLNSFTELNTQFSATSLSATEREIVQITVSVENGCAYCVAGHTAFAKMQNVKDTVVDAVRTRGVLDDPKLAALHDFTRAVVIKKGHLAAEDVQPFFDAGYYPHHLQEVILGVCTKTFSNLTSVLLDIPLDDAFLPYVWESNDREFSKSSTRKAA